MDQLQMSNEEKKSPLSKYWCFTSFKEAKPSQPGGASYVIWQQEQCPDTQRKHWQGYVEYTSKKRRHQVQQDIGDEKAHCELRRGTAQQAIDYCRKQESSIANTQEEHGNHSEPLVNQWDAIKQACANGAKWGDLVEEFTSVIAKNASGIRLIKQHYDARRNLTFVPVTVTAICGSTGVGKSRYAIDRANRDYPGSTFIKTYTKGAPSWWDGYTDQQCLIIDDFEGDASINEFLQLLGGYGHNQMWPVKGGFITISIKEVFITSNSHPSEWYKNEDHRKQRAVMRRITKTLQDQDVIDYYGEEKEDVL